MRILGPDSALDEFRLDLVQLHARLRADKNTALQALAERVTPAREALLADRASLEAAEEQLTIAQAVVSARDADLDDEEKRFSHAAKLAGAEASLFAMSPSKMTARRWTSRSSSPGISSPSSISGPMAMSCARRGLRCSARRWMR